MATRERANVTIGKKFPDGVVAVLGSCGHCGAEILLTYYAHHAFPYHKDIEYLCNCGEKTYIPIEDEWRWHSGN